MSKEIKTIYFIRHGKTWANQKAFFQTPDEPLSETGRQQAKEVALWLKDKKLDTLACSSYLRAVETAAIIGEEIDQIATPLDSVVEFKRPGSVHGRSYFSPAVFRYIGQLFRHREDPTWDYDGAENILSVRTRIDQAKGDIFNLPGERVAVVSHRFFIALFIIAICSAKPLNFAGFMRQLLLVFRIKNTDVVEFTADTSAPENTCRWSYKGRVYRYNG